MDVKNSVLVLRDRIVYLLLLLFPVLGMSVRHWLSAIFTLLVLLSLTYLIRPNWRITLTKQEKILLWTIGAFFVLFLVSAYMNNWTDRQTKYLGVEVRYLMAIPLYLMVRQLGESAIWLLRGCVVAGVFLGVQAFYDVEVLDIGHANGIYSSNLIGPFSVLVVFGLLTYIRMRNHSLFVGSLIVISITLSIYTVAMSGSRGSYFGLLVLSCIWLFMNYTGKRVLTGLLVVSAVLLLVFTINDTTSKRIHIAANEIQKYINTERKPFDCVKDGEHFDYNLYLQKLSEEGLQHCMLDGTALRFEMWRLSWLVFLDNPVWGIGRGNYEVGFDAYIKKELVHPDVNLHGHPHNAYLEVLLSKGLPGFVVFSVLLIYPLYRFVRIRKIDNSTAILGVTLIVGYAVFSLTDASPFIKGNYVSIFLVFLTCYFAREVKSSSGHAF